MWVENEQAAPLPDCMQRPPWVDRPAARKLPEAAAAAESMAEPAMPTFATKYGEKRPACSLHEEPEIGYKELILSALAYSLCAPPQGEHDQSRCRMSLEPLPRAGVPAILAAFDQVPLVALGEAHGLQEEADFLIALLHHPAFCTTVNAIVVEFGNALYQPVVDRFIAGEPVANADLRPIWRDFIGNPFGGFNAPIYEQFFRTVRAVNRTLPPQHRITVRLGDPPLDWGSVRSQDDVDSAMWQRDSHFAAVVDREVLGRARRGLLITGSLHCLRGVRFGANRLTAVQYIEQRHPGATLVVLPHTGFRERTAELEARMAAWPIPAIASVRGTWLGDLDPHLLFPTPPPLVAEDGSRDPRDPFAGLTVDAIADAYLYLGPRATLTASRPNPAIYRGDPPYLTEVQRRWHLAFEQALDTEALFTEGGPRYFDE